MSKILNDLEELLAKGVLAEEEASRIRSYYAQKPDPTSNRLVIVFGVLGSLLVGMGLVLIIAHNWDVLPKPVKLGIALTPLFIGQLICAWVLFRNITSTAWREGASVFVVFAVAAAISIVSQVYNIQGDFGNFLFIWMLLILALPYVMRSSVASLLFWIGITWYACEAGYFQSDIKFVYKYWLLALAALPWYWQLCKNRPDSNFTYFHHWIIAGSLIISLATFADHSEELLLPAYIFLFGIFILIGQLPLFSNRRLISNAYLVTGSLGIVTMLLMLSFDWYWDELNRKTMAEWFTSIELMLCVILVVIAVIIFFRLLQSKKATDLLSKSYVIPVFIVLFLLALAQPYLAQVLTNIFILILAVYTIREGAKADHLGRMNYGLMILTLLIICRFFDTDMSFVIRGILFVLVGLGFFAMNYRMVKKRKERSV